MSTPPETWANAAPAGAAPAVPAQADAVRRPRSSRRRLGDVLIESGLLTPEQLEQALREQGGSTGPRRRLGQVVVDLGLASERDMAQALAELLGLEMIDLARVMPAPDVVRLLPRAVAERSLVLVLDKGPRGLIVAAADPTNVLALDDVKLYTRTPDIVVHVATESQIRDQLARAWSIGEDRSNVSAMVDEAGPEEDDTTIAAGAATGATDEEAPIVKLVNRILADAIRLRASDIHIEVQREGLRVRFRIDGLLRDILTAPRRVSASVISRVKIMSGLDIAERRIPQDGRTRISADGKAVDARISTLPSLHGEKIVIRLLTRGEDITPLSQAGMEERQLQEFDSALAQPQGLILITGPTGSGKTNTLYSAISSVVSPETNIVTLEDPIEVQLPGITQVGVNDRIGMTFNKGLRAILRQDPDIVLVGEVRDHETAELALTASMTGHLVLTTLHTNSAIAAMTRLVDMGVEPFLVASSMTAAVAQRLVRRVCTSCTAPYTPDDVTLALLGMTAGDLVNATPRRGTGCPECGGTGYRGRTAIFEVLPVDAALRQTLLRDPSEASLGAQARAQGMITLRAAGLLKAARGETTYEEVIRVTQADAISGAGTCPACNGAVQPDMMACPWCGTGLTQHTCASCGHDLDPEWTTCPYCRTPVASSAPPVLSPRSRSTPL